MKEGIDESYCVNQGKHITPEPLEEWRSLLDLSESVLSVAQRFGVTEPYVRKRLGIPNPFISDESRRRLLHQETIALIDQEIHQLYEQKFITPDHTSEFIAALITMSDARHILELGTYSGYTTLHMIRSILGKEGGKVVSIDCRPAHDREFFTRPEIAPWFEFIQKVTPECLRDLPYMFDLVFIDSDHSVAHTEMELVALKSITKSGSILLFHDVPYRQYGLHDTTRGFIYEWLQEKVAAGILKGLVLPTAPQDDVTRVHGFDSPLIRPNLGVFMIP